jgi:hypothetical protein
MSDVLLFPENGGDVDGGIDREMRLPSPEPGSGIVGAHDGCQNESHAVDRGFQWLTISIIENPEGRFCGFHAST